MKKITVGIIGSGFAASFHVKALKKVNGIDVFIKAVAGNNLERAGEFANNHGIPVVYDTYQAMFSDEEIDVVDLCTPNRLHAQIAIEAAQAKKHIICEKPMTGFFGSPEETMSPSYAAAALKEALNSANNILQAAEVNQVKFMYAENWIYSPSVVKAKRFLQTSQGSILDIRAEQSHSGSHAQASKRLQTAGGGALITLGSHPIAAAIHLKQAEGIVKSGKPIRVQSVIADAAPLAKTEATFPDSKQWLVSDYENVESWGTVIITFTDGTRAVVIASFAALGGIRNMLDIYTSNAVIKCNMTSNDALLVYAPDNHVFGDEFISEKLGTRAGWNFSSFDEDWMRGYPQEMQDFMECIAEDRQPVSDGRLARDVIEVIYSAYLSAESGKRVELKI